MLSVLQNRRDSADKSGMLGKRAVVLVAVFTGVALELGIHAVSGRREAWDSTQYWTIGVPSALIVSAAIGFLSRGRDWIWTLLVIPSQVTTMTVRSGETGGLWPLMVLVSAVLSAPFAVAAFVGSRLRSARD